MRRGRRAHGHLLPSFAATLAVLCCVAIVAVDGPTARAATVRALDLPSLVGEAELIVVGQPRERQSRRGHRGKLIVTDISVRVEESLKGGASSDSDIVVTHMGGTLDGVGLKVPGSAAFRLGATAVIFLRTHPVTSEWRAVGMSQGVLPVALTEGVRMVSPGGIGAELMLAGPDGVLRAAPGALTSTMRLQDFAAEVRRLVLQQRAR